MPRGEAPALVHQRFETDADAEIGLPAEPYGHERDAGEQRAETPLKALDHRARHAVEGDGVDDPADAAAGHFHGRPETPPICSTLWMMLLLA